MVGTNGRTFEAQNPEDSSVNQNGFAGVDPIYQNAANATDKPLDDPAAAKAAEKAGTKLADKANKVQPADRAISGDPEAQASDGTAEEEPDEEEKKDEGSSTPTPVAPQAASVKSDKK